MIKKIQEYKEMNGGSLYETAAREMRAMRQLLEAESRLLIRTWIHVDMDMFYAAVEIRDRPELATIPVAIGSDSMISTANYVARKYGVRSAMPGFIARKLCPQLVFVPCSFEKYREVSLVFKEIVEEYDPEFESMGLDETNLDVTEYCRAHEIVTDDQKQMLALEIRTRVNEATKLTCSAGIACNKMLAKICSDINKPNGQTFLKADAEVIREFMANMDVRKIPGIGRMTELTLSGLQVRKCKDVLDKAPEIMISFKENTAQFLLKCALGISRTFHEECDDEALQKSISTSSTFKPVRTKDQFIAKITELCDDLAMRM